MSKAGAIVVMGGVIVILAVTMYMFTQTQTNLIESSAGKAVMVGPVEYTITFEGTHEGNKDTKPEHAFVKVGIIAKNTADKKTMLSGGQFFLIDEKKIKHEAVYGEFSPKDLLVEWLEYDKPVQRETQFDVPYDEENQYNLVIRPQKTQSTTDTAVICLTHCKQQ